MVEEVPVVPMLAIIFTFLDLGTILNKMGISFGKSLPQLGVAVYNSEKICERVKLIYIPVVF